MRLLNFLPFGSAVTFVLYVGLWFFPVESAALVGVKLDQASHGVIDVRVLGIVIGCLSVTLLYFYLQLRRKYKQERD